MGSNRVAVTYKKSGFQSLLFVIHRRFIGETYEPLVVIFWQSLEVVEVWGVQTKTESEQD